MQNQIHQSGEAFPLILGASPLLVCCSKWTQVLNWAIKRTIFLLFF